MKLSSTATLLLFAAALPSFGQLSENVKSKLGEAERNSDVRNLAPVDVAPEPDAAEFVIRTIRNRLHNTTRPCATGNLQSPDHLTASRRAKNDGCMAVPTLEQLPEDVPSKITYVDLPPLPDLPVRFSDTIVTGIVNRVQPYLSEDKTNIYTEYEFVVSQVFRHVNGLQLNPGDSIVLDRMGGAIGLASGRVLRDVVEGNGAPLTTGKRYVLFLQYDARGNWFRTVKSWELWNGVAIPLDPGDIAAAQQGQSRFAGTSETDFVKAIGDAVQH